jgi:NADPH:quinone reductase-like Zn-dependent oxidoreductase/malonyl CoA-acyl carrier protein transacylase
MASGLRHYKAFAAAIDKAEEHLRDMGATWSLTEELKKPATDSRVDDAEISQPACTAIQLALVALLKTWGVTPGTVTGHSSGEIAAAYAAGLVSFRTAVAIAYFRGQAAGQLSRNQTRQGAMLALGVCSEDAARLIEEHAGCAYATVAAINSANSVTVSGDVSAIENIHKAADAQGLFVRRLKISLAYHSRHMEDVAGWYLDAIQPFYDEDAAVAECGPRAVFVSSVTGSAVEPSSVGPSYWVKNLVQPVRFSDAIQSLFIPRDKSASTKIPNVVVEIGPHAALKNPIKQTVDLLRPRNAQALKSFTYLPSLLRDTASDEALLSLAGGLFTAGISVQLGAVNQTDLHNAHVLTDLPAYAWDKSVSYQIMPRNTKELLFPGEPFHALLGRKTASTGAHERTYRQVFTLDDIPWIRDHNVSGAVIFPMTGYLSNAIEAARRVISSPAATFVVRDFHAVRSLEIQEEQSIDMVTKLKPAATGTGSFSATAWSFEVATWSEEGGWATHCYGRIEAEAAEMSMQSPTLLDSLSLINAPNMEEHDIKAAYAHTGLKGTRYGPAFLNTTRYQKGDGFTVIEQQLRGLGKMLPSPYGSPYSVDPPTLDGFLQGGGTFKEIDWTRLALMPTFVNRLRVSNSIPTDPDQLFTVVTRLLGYDVKGGRMRMSVAAFVRGGPDGSYVPVAKWESVIFRALVAGDGEDPATALPVNWRWEMLPRLDLLPADELTKRFKFSVGELAEAQLSHGQMMHQVACYYIDKALEATAGDDRSKLPHHLSSFARWSGRAAAREHIDSAVDPAMLVEKVRNNDAQGELLCAIGDVLVPILRDEVQPLEVMLKDGLLTRHYEADVSNAMFSQIVGDLVHNLSHLEPNMRILEIGGGTAGTTLHVLNALSRDSEDGAFLQYTFTDISSGFFEKARTKLARWAHGITYEKLDISKDPAAQGFTLGQFDLVIAANVLHATANMVDTMTHVRSLLRPNGRLICLEANRHAPLALPFALLPGWWYAEDDYRDHEEGPLLTTDAWDRLLVNTGFSGIDVLLQDRPGEPDQMLSVFSSTRVGKPEPSTCITVCGPFMDDDEVDFAQAVADSLAEQLGCPSTIKPFAEVDPAEDPYCLFIDSPRQSLLDDVSADTFETLKRLVSHNTGLLWVVPEGGPPEAHIIKGLLRTLRLEHEPKHLLMLDGIPSTAQGADAILQIAKMLRDPEVAGGEDQDFFWRDGAIHQSRMRPMKELKERFGVEQGVPVRTVQNIWEGEGALEMTMESAGSPESIYFQRTDLLRQKLADDEVVVQVEAAGLSVRDLNLIFGTVPWAPPGFDGVGKVVKTGSRVAHLHEGDRVLFLSLEGSAFATYKKLPLWHVARVPSDMGMADAASMPFAYTVALAALVHTARLRRDETVLVHSASGGVGQACVVIAQHLGARVFATADTAEKRAFLHEAFGIPESHIFSSRTSQFRNDIMCATGGKGVDVVVNSLSGELMHESWELTAAFGRFVDISMKEAVQNSNLAMKPFERSATFHSVDLRALFQHRPESVREIFSEFVSLLRRGVAVPIKPVTVVPISQFVDGLRMLKAGNNTGKIVVTLGKEDRVLADSALRPTKAPLDPNATVLITGGTRGIGLALAHWMIENGSKNVVVLGRTGSANPEVQKLLQKYEGTDVTARALACDVGDKLSLVDALESIKDMPPVRGVVHSALILNVSGLDVPTNTGVENDKRNG